jgi:hypothetical protein
LRRWSTHAGCRRSGRGRRRCRGRRCRPSRSARTAARTSRVARARRRASPCGRASSCARASRGTGGSRRIYVATRLRILRVQRPSAAGDRSAHYPDCNPLLHPLECLQKRNSVP